MSNTDIDRKLAVLVKDAFPEPAVRNSLLPGVRRRIRRRRRLTVAGIATVAALVMAGVITPLALHDSGTSPATDHSSTPAWATRCFQAWDDRQHINARLDTRPIGLNSEAVTKFAHSHNGILTVIAKRGQCVDDWIDSATQAHVPAHLLVAFDHSGHVAAAWFAPGRGGVITRPSPR